MPRSINVETEHGSLVFTPSTKAQAELDKLNSEERKTIVDMVAGILRHELRNLNTMHLSTESVHESLHPEHDDATDNDTEHSMWFSDKVR